MFKKLLSIFTAVMLSLTMISGVFAENTNQSTLTVVKEGATFSAYQVLNAKPSGDVYKYSVSDAFKDFFTSSDYTFDATKGIMKGGQVFLPTDQANTTNTSKPTKVVPSEDMAAFTKALQDYMKKNDTKNYITASLPDSTQTSLDKGYYLVLETNNTIDNGIVASKAMMINLVEDKTIYPKDDQGGLTKKIMEGATELDKNSAGVGDTIQYVVDAVVPTYDRSVTQINYTFTDKMSKGLAYQDDLKVKLGNDTLTKDTDYTLTVDGDSTQGTTLQINITNSTKLLNSTDKKVSLTYSAKLTSDAVVNQATTNDIQLDYSRIPGVNETTLKDRTETYTYGLKIIKKADEHNGKTLAGAKFALYQGNKQIGQATSTEQGEVQFKDMSNRTLGLDEGTYILREEQAPSGYSTLGKDLKLTLTKNSQNTNQPIVTITSDEGDIKEATITNESVSVVNYKGISLPETGGKGTTIFMIIGGCLVVIALLVYGIYELKGRKE